MLRLIAPSGPLAEEEFLRGVAFLREHFEVRYRDDIVARDGFLAGNDGRRLRELQEALDDDEANAILAVRGGHGALRIIDKIDAKLVGRVQKPIIGFSDITALHLLWARAQVPSLHASMVGALGRDEDIRRDWLSAVRALLERQPLDPITNLEVWRPGDAEGRLIGGNLRVIASVLSTPHAPSFENVVLFLEDVGEHAYRVDRLLTSLRLHGIFDQVAAVILGDFHQCPSSGGQSCEEVLRRFFVEAPFPVLFGLQAGHGKTNRPVHLNVEAMVRGGELHYPG